MERKLDEDSFIELFLLVETLSHPLYNLLKLNKYLKRRGFYDWIIDQEDRRE